MTETEEKKEVIYRFGRFEVNVKEQLLRSKGEIVPLTSKIFETLLLLIENNGRMLSKDEILEKVWKDSFVEETNLTSNISRLRKILHTKGERFIETFPKRGYRFQADVEEIPFEVEVVMRRRMTARIQQTVEEESEAPPALLLPAGRRRKMLVPALLLLLLTAVTAAWWFGWGKSSEIKSLAVLPFQNAGGDANLDSLSERLSENLIDRLSQIGELKIITRSSSVRFKDKEIDPKEIGKTLDVQSLLIGSVERRGEILTIRVELVDARDGSRLWGEQYNIGESQAQNIEGVIARRITSRLNLSLTKAQDERLTRTETDNLQAYQLYLNGVLQRRKGNAPENARKAIEYYNQAVALDPNFAQAYVALANAYRYLQGFSLGDNKAELKEKMYQAIQRAQELDASSYDAHLTVAGIRINELDWANAENEYKRAIELNPNSAGAHGGYAGFLSIFERHDEALTHIKLAQELDPLSINLKVSVGRTLVIARRYDEAIEYLKKIIESEPNNGFARYYLGVAYVSKGMYDEALAEYDAGNKTANESPGPFYAFALARAGKKDAALKIIEGIKNKGDYSPAEFAIAYVAVGNYDEAFTLLERAYQERDLQLQYLRVDPHYDEIRSDPRFQDLVKRVGL
jgi:DNA-binding winged helix-turn-helix (wHTH) protein/TolB-like protein/predicted Zn-dependent protease